MPSDPDHTREESYEDPNPGGFSADLRLASVHGTENLVLGAVGVGTEADVNGVSRRGFAIFVARFTVYL